MTSEITDSFRQGYGQLHAEIKVQTKRAYKMWISNPRHPGLHFKKIHATEPIWSVRVGIHYRTVGVMHDDRMIWYFIGTHPEYDKFIKS